MEEAGSSDPRAAVGERRGGGWHSRDVAAEGLSSNKLGIPRIRFFSFSQLSDGEFVGVARCIIRSNQNSFCRNY